MEIDEVSGRFAAALAAGDLDALMRLYAPDAVLIPGPDRPPLVGHEAIRGELSTYLGSPSTIRTIDRSTHVNGSLALITATWEITADDGTTQRGTAAEVLRRESDGRWVYVIDNPYGA